MLRISCLFVLALASCTDGPTPTTCERSIADFCADTTLPCPLTFTAAQDTASWGGCGGRTSQDDPLVVKYCGAVNVVEMHGIDAFTSYVYNATSGQLVSVASHMAVGPRDTCMAGEALNVQCGQQQHDLCP